jgi:hypothetical protein
VLDAEKGTQEVLEPNDEEDEALASDGEAPTLVVNKNIENTPHQYEAVVGDAAIEQLVKTLLEEKEICIDTETTGIDANNVELVGLSFSIYLLPMMVMEKTEQNISCLCLKNYLTKKMFYG